MQVVVYSCKHRVVHAKGFIKQRVFVSLPVAGAAGIHLVVKLRVRDMKLEWSYADDRPIFFMELNELESILAAEDKIVVEFIPSDNY